jgi:hypothetical protein
MPDKKDKNSARAYLLRGAKKDSVGIRIKGTPRQADFFEKVIIRWHSDDAFVAINDDGEMFISNGDEEFFLVISRQHDIEPLLDWLASFSNKIISSDGWDIFGLTDGRSGLNIISSAGVSACINSWLDSLGS